MSAEDENKTAWQKYKEKLGDTRPWDILNPNTEYVDETISEKRYSICLSCPELTKTTKQCKQCGCLMSIKTKLAVAECPIGKWGKEINV
jgi:hypothetical protein